MTSVADAKARLSEYLDRAEKGERIVICRHNKPIAELRAVETARAAPRPIGPIKGRLTFTIAASFFEALTDDELDEWERGSAADPLASSLRGVERGACPASWSVEEWRPAQTIHRDPFDRMLISQAIAHGLAIVTPDPAIAQHSIRVIW